jgi:RNA polymerase sigma-70 factor (TIGR02960 family)
MPAFNDLLDASLLSKARAGDQLAFDRLVSAHRGLLHAHCYRMLGSPHDADDALQETLLAAWRGLTSFEGRSALATWLYRISTNVCLRLISRRPCRLESPDYGPAFVQTESLGDMVTGPVWLEPLPDNEISLSPPNGADPFDELARRESVSLAFVAALQHLPGKQRAVLLLRVVLEFTAAETADLLDISVVSVNSALQRAQKKMRERKPVVSQAAERRSLGDAALDQLLDAFVTAWESQDIKALVRLFTEDVRFTMPPLPSWFDGLQDVENFIAQRVFATPWRLLPLRANGQVGFACYLKADSDDHFRLGAVMLLDLRGGQISCLRSFLDPAVHRRFGLAEKIF